MPTIRLAWRVPFAACCDRELLASGGFARRRARELARTHTEAAINRLVFWMQSENPRASVAASNALLDRAYGKPVAPIEMEVGEFDHMTEEELNAWITETASKLGIEIVEA